MPPHWETRQRQTKGAPSVQTKPPPHLAHIIDPTHFLATRSHSQGRLREATSRRKATAGITRNCACLSTSQTFKDRPRPQRSISEDPKLLLIRVQPAQLDSTSHGASMPPQLPITHTDRRTSHTYSKTNKAPSRMQKFFALADKQMTSARPISRTPQTTERSCAQSASNICQLLSPTSYPHRAISTILCTN